MSATIIILPVVQIERYGEDRDRAERKREKRARIEMPSFGGAPPRSRPILWVDNEA